METSIKQSTTPPTETELRPSLAEIQALCQEDMQSLDSFIRSRLRSEVVLINQIAEYIIHSGGKRIRPLLLILAARASGYTGPNHIALAAVIELIHTATLLHDDIVDESELRRGHKTAHSVWGNATAVLVGDFLYSRSFQIMTDVGEPEVMRILSDTTNTIAEGEVLQLLNMGDPEVDERRYMQVIKNKTAKLFEAATSIGALLAGDQAAQLETWRDFGMLLGCAFQISDDIMDYTADAMGKNLGDDLAEGKPTLPLIYARQLAPVRDRELLDQAVRSGGRQHLSQVIEIIHRCGALQQAQEKADQLSTQASRLLEPTADSAEKSALQSLCWLSVNRSN